METVTVRELRNHGGEVLERVARGQRLTVTMDGRPVAELRPVSSRPLSAATLLERWRHLPKVDPRALRDDVDRTVDTSV